MKRILRLIALLLLITPSAILADDKDIKDKLSYAANLFQSGNYIKTIDELKSISKDFPEANYLIGMSYKALGNFDAASEWLQKASEYKPVADYALYHLGKNRLNTPDYPLALSAFQMLLSKYPESRWREESSFYAADALFQNGSYKEATEHFNRFITENPWSILMSKALLSSGQSSEKEGKTEEAFNRYKSIWLRFPSSPESKTASLRMAELSTTEQSLRLRLPSFDERYGRVSALFSSGSRKDGIGELASLIKEIEKAGGEPPTWMADARLKLGEAYFHVREDEKAEAVLKKMAEDNSTPEMHKDVLFLYGKLLQRSGKRMEAASLFEKIEKDYSGEYAARSIYRLADMAESDGNIGKAKELYRRLYSEFPKDGLADDALWKEGWLGYLEGNYDAAFHAFQRLLNVYTSSEYRDTVSYWMGKTAEKTGSDNEAVKQYINIINDYPLSYYAVPARKRLAILMQEKSPSDVVNNIFLKPLIKQRSADPYVSYHFDKAKVLLNLGFREDASSELSLAEGRCSDKGTLLEIARFMTKAGDYNRAKRIALKAFPDYLRGDARPDADIWKFAFPAGFSEEVRINAEKNSLDPYLVHAIIREESSYKFDAVSSAGAIGLMQLMPFTGSFISKKRGFKNYSVATLYKPEVNITLGTMYLKKIIERYDGNLPLAIASYNAGPNAVNSWISKFGTDDMDEFMEKIPYTETRNYVKKVLRSYDIYEKLYGTGTLQQIAINDSTAEDEPARSSSIKNLD